MKVTKIIGLTLVFALLVVPASVHGRSLQECLSDYYTAAFTITEVSEICGLTRTLLTCVASGQSLNDEQQEQLKKSLQSEFDKHNLKCDYTVDEVVDEAFNGGKTISTPPVVDKVASSVQTTARATITHKDSESTKTKSLQECLNDYYSAAFTITEVSEICGLTRKLLTCVASGHSLNYEQQEQLKKSLQSEFDKHNLKCGYTVDEVVDEAFNGVKTISTPPVVDKVASSVQTTARATISDKDSSSFETKSLEECLNDYYSDAFHIKEFSEVCRLVRTLLNCVARGHSLKSEHREAVKKFIQSEFKKYNLNCDYSVDALVDEAFNGAKISSTSLSFLTLILVAFGGFTLVRNLA